MVAIFSGSDAPAGEWKRLPSLPDNEGFAGPLAGVSNGALIVAGGANFPDKKPWDGGKKVWYDTVFVLEKPNGEWKIAGKLPRPVVHPGLARHGDGEHDVQLGHRGDRRGFAEVQRPELAQPRQPVAPPDNARITVALPDKVFHSGLAAATARCPRPGAV